MKKRFDDLCWNQKCNNFQVTYYPTEPHFFVRFMVNCFRDPEVLIEGCGDTFDLAIENGIEKLEQKKIDEMKKQANLIGV